MKALHFILIAISALLMMSITGCVKDSKAAEVDICDSNRRTVIVANELAGQLSYNNELERWVINTPIPGTLDGLRTCIVCGEIAGEFKTPGLTVLFSGELKESNGYPMPIQGGQVMYYVRPGKIRKA